MLFNAFKNVHSSVSVGVAAATQTSERFSPRQRSWRCPSCTFLRLWKIIAAVYEREVPRRNTSSRAFGSPKSLFSFFLQLLSNFGWRHGTPAPSGVTFTFQGDGRSHEKEENYADAASQTPLTSSFPFLSAHICILVVAL